MRGLEFLGTSTSLIGSDSLDGNDLLSLGKPLGVLDGGGKEPEEERTGEDGEDGGDDEDELPGFDMGGFDVADGEGHEGTEHGSLFISHTLAFIAIPVPPCALTIPLVPYQKATRRGCS